ncbi:MAG: DUF2877 domain-containing protein [Roseiarcus sp.]
MRLAALTAGAGVPEGDFVGRVEEVHTGACLCALSDGKWLTLLRPDLGGFPCGVTLDAPRGFSFKLTLRPGPEVAARGGVLRVAGHRLNIDLRAARPWRSRLGDLKLDLGKAATARAWRAARRALRRDGRDAELLRVAGAVIDELAGAASRLDAAAAQDAMGRLVGLGEGRTPAGDDFLVGYFAGLQACADGADAGRQFLATLGARLRALSTRANRVSRVYLKAAADGEVSERLRAVAASIAEGCDAAAVDKAVAAALAVGHSSGACGVLGLLRACAVHGGDVAEQAPR